MGIKQVLLAPRSPWHRAYVERLIGTLRRECLDHSPAINQLHFQVYGSERHLSSTNSVVHFTPNAISEIDS